MTNEMLAELDRILTHYQTCADAAKIENFQIVTDGVTLVDRPRWSNAMDALELAREKWILFLQRHGHLMVNHIRECRAAIWACHEYFDQTARAWDANDEKLVDANGNPYVESGDLSDLLEKAAGAVLHVLGIKTDAKT